MQPNGVRVPGDELLDGHAVFDLRSRNTLLFAIDEDEHEHHEVMIDEKEFVEVNNDVIKHDNEHEENKHHEIKHVNNHEEKEHNENDHKCCSHN